MHRATVLSSICALACLSACKSESAPAADATAAPAQAGSVMVAEEAPAAEPEPESAKPADSAAVPGSAPAPEASERKDSKTRDDAGAPVPGMADGPKPIIQGNLDRDIIRRVVRSNIGDVRDCYNAGLRNNAALGGTLTIDFTIDARGRVEQSKPAEGGEFEDPKVAQCIADAIANWEFPATGGEVTVSYPFNLDPG